MLVFGTRVSSQTYQRSFSNSAYYSVSELPSGTIIATGAPANTSDNNRLLFQRLTSSGNLLESRTVTASGGIGFDVSRPPHMILQDGDSILLSCYSSSISGNTSIYPGLAKVDTNGHAAWWNSYTNALSTSAPNPRGSLSQTFKSMDGNYVSSGWFHPGSTGGSFDYYPMIQKVDPNGNEIWRYNFPFLTFEFMHCATESTTGNYTISGGLFKTRVITVDENGTLLWGYSYDINGINQSEATTILPLNDGGYLLVGSVSNPNTSDRDGYLAQIDSLGDIQWASTYGGAGDDYFYKAAATADGGFIIGGQSASFSNGDTDGWLTKVDAMGNVSWSRKYGNDQEETINGLISFSGGGYIAVGAKGDDGYLIKTDDSGMTGCNDTLVTLTVTDATSASSKTAIISIPGSYSGVSPQTVMESTYDVSGSDRLFLSDSICEGETYDFNGTTLTTTGVYYDTYPGRVDCDSVVELSLYVHEAFSTQTATICDGETFSFAGATLTESGVYSDSLISQVMGCDSVIELTLTVLDSADPQIDLDSFVLSTGSFASYQWLLDGQPITGATAQTYAITENGSYSVQVTDLNGCQGLSDSISIINVGIETRGLGQAFIRIYPNPISTNTAVVRAQTRVERVDVLDMSGKVVLRANEDEVDVTSLSNGLYFFRVNLANGITETVKVVKAN